MKKLYKRMLPLLAFGLCLMFITPSIHALTLTDDFINYQTYNSDVSFNYGSLVENATENNNYRNYLDTSVQASDFEGYDAMTQFSNDVDYASYINQQQVYEYDDNSFNLTNGEFEATFNFDNETEYNTNFFESLDASTEINLVSDMTSHKDVLELYDNSGSGQPSTEFSIDKEFGTIELYVLTTDSSKKFEITFYDESDNALIRYYIDAGNFISYYDSSEHVLTTITSNEWYHLRIDFESRTFGYLGLSQYETQVAINGISYDACGFNYDSEPITDISFHTDNTDSGYYCYVDALGIIGYSSIYDGNYDGIYSFENEIGYSGNSIDFVDSSVIESGCSISVIENLELHQSVLKINSNPLYTRAYLKHLFDETPSINFSIEYWSYQATTSGFNQIAIYDQFDNEAFYVSTSTHSSDYEWYRVRLDVDCLDDEYSLYINDVLMVDSLSFSIEIGSASYLELGSIKSDVPIYCYYDGIGIVHHENTGYYNATYDFNDEIGMVDDESSFVYYAILGSGGSVSVIQQMENHQGVLEIDSSPSSSRTYIRHNLDNDVNNVNFSIEFWTLQTGINRIGFFDENSIPFKWIDISSYSDNNVWNHIRIDVDTINGNISIYVNDVCEVYSATYQNPVGSIDFLLIGALYSDSSSIMYYDAIGFKYYSNTGYWNATYDFNDELGLTGTNIDFIDYINNPSASIIDGYKGHKNVLELDSDGYSYTTIYNTLEQQVYSGTIEFFVLNENMASNFITLHLRETSTNCINVRLYNNKLESYNGTTWIEIKSGLNEKTWYHIRYDFYINNTFDVYVDNVYQGNYDFRYEMNQGINRIVFESYNGYFALFDAIGIYYNQTGNYDASFNFDTLNNFSYNEPTNTSVSLIDYYDNHNDVLKLFDNSSTDYCQIFNYFEQQTKGTVEFWINSEQYDQHFYWYLSGSSAIYFRIAYSSNLIQYSLSGWNTIYSLPYDNTWYHIRIDFSELTHTFNFYVNSVLVGNELPYSTIGSYFNVLSFYTGSSYKNTNYVDGLGYSWYDNYSIGQNYFDYYDDYGNYNASFNCDNLDDFSNVDWINTETNIVDYQNEHISVISQYDNNDTKDSQLNLYFDDTISGTIEFYWSSNDTYKASYFTFYEGSSSKGYLRMRYDSMRVYDNIADYHLINVYDNVWYHIRIDFDCNDDTFDIYIDNIFYRTCYFWSNPTSLNRIIWNTRGSDLGYISYIDSVGISWLSNYSIGQNLDYVRYNTYEIGSNYDEYLQAYSNTYELGSNQVEFLQAYDNTYEFLDNLYSGYATRFYTKGDNILSEYITDYDSETPLMLERIDVLGTYYLYGILEINGLYYCIGGVSYDLFVFEPTLQTYLYSYDFTGYTGLETRLYDDGTYVYLSIANSPYGNDYTMIFDLELNYVNTIDDAFIYYKDGYFYDLAMPYIYKYHPNYTLADTITITKNGYSLSNSIEYRMMYDTSDNLYICSYDDTYDYLYQLNDSYYVVESIYIGNDYNIMNINQYDELLAQPISLGNNYLDIYSLNGLYYIEKQTMMQYYLYDTGSSQTGKIEIIVAGYSGIYTEYLHTRIYITVYTYDGSYDLVYHTNFKVELYDINSFEFETHVVIGYVNSFKKLMIQANVYLDDVLTSQTNANIDYMSSYAFDKMTLHSYNYTQETNPLYDDENEQVINVNTNYFKNDLYGYRIIACLDLTQKFNDFYAFGTFFDELDITNIELPETPDDFELNAYWQYQVSTIIFDQNTTIQTANFEFVYPLVRVEINVENYYYNDALIPLLAPNYITDDWSFVWNWLRDGINFILTVIYLIPNIFITIINFIWIGIQFVGYLITLVFQTLLMTYIVGGVIILVWNILIFGLFVGIMWLIDALYIFIYGVLPDIVYYIVYNILPLLLDIIGLLLSLIIATILYIISGGQANLLELIDIINTFFSNFFDMVYVMIVFVVEHIVVILSYFGIMIIIIYMLYGKYIYVEAKGHESRKQKIKASYDAYTSIPRGITKLTRSTYDLFPVL